jgi:hypothetical protein
MSWPWQTTSCLKRARCTHRATISTACQWSFTGCCIRSLSTCHQTHCEDCCDKLRFLGKEKAGLQELWNELGKRSAGVQTMQRRMVLQLGFLEREGCIRLDQVWNSPTNTKMNQAYLAISDQMMSLKEAPNEHFQTRAYVISEELGQALKDMATWGPPRRSRRRLAGSAPPPWRWSSLAPGRRARAGRRAGGRSGPGKRGRQPGKRGGQPRWSRSGPWRCPNLSTC